MADKNVFFKLLAEMLIRMSQQQGERKQTNEILPFSKTTRSAHAGWKNLCARLANTSIY
jgi:hypothetical protein